MKRYISKHDLKPRESHEEYIAIAGKWREQERKFHHYLCDHEYDGILGEPPDWVPEHIKKQFFEARISIFDNTIDIVNKPHNPKVIKIDMELKLAGQGVYKDPGEGFSVWGSPSNVKDRDLYIRDFKFLMRLWSIVQKGKIAALRDMAGDTSFQEYKKITESEIKSDAGKGKRGKEGSLKATIRKLQSNNIGELLSVLRNDDLIEDRYQSNFSDKRIDIHEVEIYVTKERNDHITDTSIPVDGYINYKNRNGQPKKSTFKNLKNIISKLNNE